MNKRKYIFGNWKMNGLQAEAVKLADAIAAQTIPDNIEAVLFPPFISLFPVAQSLKSTSLKLGGQDCSLEERGAFTGDISAKMLKDVGCMYVILGHSERRVGHNESDVLVKSKAEAAIKEGLIPIICIGENIEERMEGKYLEYIESQVKHSVPVSAQPGSYILAYEPIWAIGSGKTPTIAEIVEVHKTIESVLSCATSSPGTRVVYGGSVKTANAHAILTAEKVDGVLVGGASLDAKEFGSIIEMAKD
jgi:triosephosphate isomerase